MTIKKEKTEKTVKKAKTATKPVEDTTPMNMHLYARLMAEKTALTDENKALVAEVVSLKADLKRERSSKQFNLTDYIKRLLKR